MHNFILFQSKPKSLEAKNFLQILIDAREDIEPSIHDI